MTETYINNIQVYSKKLNKLQKSNRLISYIRAILFIVEIFIIYNSTSFDYKITISITIFIIAIFLFFVKKNIKLKNEIRKQKNLIKINEDEISALNGNWNIFHDGKEYIDFNHPFSYDLDVFGEGSLFQYLNRTTLIAGKNKLAKKLTKLCLNKNNIENKQLAVKELSNRMGWRQNFLATSLTNDKKTNKDINSKEDVILNNLKEWSSEKLNFINKSYWKYVLTILPAIVIVFLLLAILNLVPYSFVGFIALINLGIVGKFLKKINKEHSKLTESTKSLSKIKELVRIIETSNFNSEYIKKNKNILTEDKAFARIKELHKTLNAFDLRLNMIAGVLLNAFLMLDLQVLRKLEKQKKHLYKNIELWFDVIGEFDSLISLANFHFNNPNYIFPKISVEDFDFRLTEGGHPLIDSKNLVTNSFTIEGLHNIIIVTGANMAGKSTFLRTIGINLILGTLGTPVCAKEMVFTPINIYTSVRTNDSLQKNESYFYAELMRLKKITDSLKAKNKLFVIIDEMLRGTNSKDKHLGSYELIKQLIKYKTVGLVATHDIQLGKLIDEYPNNISNKRFEVEIINDEVVFDYKIKDGISQNLNASFLMKKYGIIE